MTSIVTLLLSVSVGVVTLGDDPTQTGVLQADLEASLAQKPDFTVVGAGDLAGRIGDEAFTVTTPDIAHSEYLRIKPQGDKLLEQAKEAYYRNRTALALDRLGALAGLYGPVGHVPIAKRVQLYLWRAAVFLASDEQGQAEAEALRALTLEPGLAVDVTEFRPSVGEIVDAVRKKGLKKHTVTFNGLPKGAVLYVDGKRRKSKVVLPEGRHWLLVSSAGFHPVAKAFETVSDTSISIHMPLAVEPAIDGTLRALTGTTEPSIDDAVRKTIADKTKTDYLMVTLVRSTGTRYARSVLLSLDAGGVVTPSTRVPADRQAAAELAAWAVRTLKAATVVVSNASIVNPTPAATPPLVTIDKPNSGWFIHTEGGPLAVNHTRVMTSENGEEYQLTFLGSGGYVTAETGWKGFLLSTDFQLHVFTFSTNDLNLPSGGRSEVNGGATLLFHVLIGYRFTFRKRAETSPSVTFATGYTYKDHGAQDLQDTTGPVGVIPSYTHRGLIGKIAVRYPFRMGAGALAPHAGIGVGFANNFEEVPEGLSGMDPIPEATVRFQAGLDYSFKRWRIAATWVLDSVNVRYTGTATAPFTPSFTNSVVNDRYTVLQLGIRRRF